MPSGHTGLMDNPRRRRPRLASLLPGMLLLTVLGTVGGTVPSSDRSAEPVVELQVRPGH